MCCALLSLASVKKTSKTYRFTISFQASNFICIMCGVCHTLLKTKLGGGQKKGKKKKEARPQMVRDLLISISALCK